MGLPAFTLALAALLQAPNAPKARWEPVLSQEGRFSCEMPTQPTSVSARSRSGAGGQVSISIVACGTNSGVYLIYKIEFPTAIARGAEEALLDSERNEFAQIYHGKPLTEKRVRLDGRVGRDFTIRGQAPGEGVSTVRIREYLEGRAIYALVVASPPNFELPEDAGRFFGSFQFGLKKPGSAKPRQELIGTPVEGWGIALDPFADSQIRPEGNALSVLMPGMHKDTDPGDDRGFKAPRVLRDVVGDFSVQVKVVGEFKPAGKTTNPKFVPYNGAGLLLYSDAENFIRLERAAVLRKGKVSTYASLEEWEGGGRGASHNGPLPPGDAILRLERHGGRIIAGVSSDGAKWVPLQPIDVRWPAKLQVGVAVVNSNTEPISVKFEDFALKSARP